MFANIWRRGWTTFVAGGGHKWKMRNAELVIMWNTMLVKKRNTELVKMKYTDRLQVCYTCSLALWHVCLILKYLSDEFSEQQGMTKRPFIATFKQWIRWWYVENSFDQRWSVDRISIVDEHPLSSDHQCSFADCLMHLKVNMVWSGWWFSADFLSRSKQNKTLRMMNSFCKL